CRPGTAEIIRHPGEGQPRLFERIPQRLRPHALLGLVDRGGLAQILEDSGRGIDDDVVRLVAHLAAAPVSPLPAIVEQPSSNGKTSPEPGEGFAVPAVIYSKLTAADHSPPCESSTGGGSPMRNP